MTLPCKMCKKQTDAQKLYNIQINPPDEYMEIIKNNICENCAVELTKILIGEIKI